MEKETKTPTRAEKREAAKSIIREILQKAEKRNNDLIDEAAKIFSERFGDEETDNANDVKGRIGSVLDLMKKDGEVRFDGGMCALNAPKTEERTEEKTEEKPKTKRKSTSKKAVAQPVATEENVVEKTDEKPKTKRTRKTAKAKAEETADEEKKQPLPPAPVQPIAPVAPITPEIAPEPIPEKTDEKSAPKKRARKTKSAEVKEEPSVVVEEKAEVKEQPKVEEKQPEKTENSPKGTLMDMSFLFGGVKPLKKEEKPAIKAVETPKEQVKEKPEVKTETRAEVKKTESKPQPQHRQ